MSKFFKYVLFGLAGLWLLYEMLASAILSSLFGGNGLGRLNDIRSLAPIQAIFAIAMLSGTERKYKLIGLVAIVTLPITWYICWTILENASIDYLSWPTP